MGSALYRDEGRGLAQGKSNNSAKTRLKKRKAAGEGEVQVKR